MVRGTEGAYDGFNPRSRTGSDAYEVSWVFPVDGFNPRSRTGSDQTKTESFWCTIAVSIHAPARGATAPNNI